MLNFVWPRGLSVRDLRRLFWAKETLRLPDLLGELTERGVYLSLEDAHGLCAQIVEVSNATGFFVLDDNEHPEKLALPELPICVKSAIEAEYIEFRGLRAMQRILDLFHGKTLPTDLDEATRDRELAQIRRWPVVSKPCRKCGHLFVLTVDLVAKAIEGNSLIEQGKLYEPSTLCFTCRRAHVAELKAKRESSALPPVRAAASVPVGLTVTLRDQTDYKDKKKKDKKGKRTDVDQGIALVTPVAVKQEQEQPQLALTPPEELSPEA